MGSSQRPVLTVVAIVVRCSTAQCFRVATKVAQTSTAASGVSILCTIILKVSLLEERPCRRTSCTVAAAIPKRHVNSVLPLFDLWSLWGNFVFPDASPCCRWLEACFNLASDASRPYPERVETTERTRLMLGFSRQFLRDAERGKPLREHGKGLPMRTRGCATSLLRVVVAFRYRCGAAITTSWITKDFVAVLARLPRVQSRRPTRAQMHDLEHQR